jgi:hypothetical protein
MMSTRISSSSTRAGMVQANVGQKLLKSNILRSFYADFFCSGTPIPQEMRHFRSRSL